MRKLLSALTAILTSLLVAAGPAWAAPAHPTECADDPWEQLCFFPAPSGWIRVNYPFHDCTPCREAGAAGVADGRWPEYRCHWFPSGLDIVYYIYLPPEG